MRILGLDLGTSSIKAIEIDSAFSRYELRDYYERQVQTGQRPVDAAAILLRGLAKKPDRIAVSLPPSLVTQRNLTVPTRDKKAVKAAVAFELEDDLPFDLESTAYDYSVLSQGSEGSKIHIAISLQKQVKDFLGLLQSVGIDPDLITTESWSFRTYLNRIVSPAHQDAPVMLVHIGANSTSIYLQNEGTPLFHQLLPWGGNDLTFAISSEYGLTPAEAERDKCERGLLVPGSEAQQGERIECRGQIIATLNRLILEIRQALLSCKSMTQQLPQQIFFCGGGSQVAGLRELLAPEIHIGIRPLQALSAISLSGVSYSEQADASYLLSTALGLCLVGPDRNHAINLRRGELAKAGTGSGLDFEAFKGPLISAGIISACLVGSLVTESIVYKAKLKKEDTLLESSMRGVFPNLSSSAKKNFLTSPSKLREAVQKEVDAAREAAMLYGPNPHSPMGLLKTLSQGIPGAVVVDMAQFQVGAAVDSPYKSDASTDASITFIVQSAPMVDRLSDTLSKYLSGLQRSKTEEVPSPDGNGKRIRVTFTGKPTESAYGK